MAKIDTVRHCLKMAYNGYHCSRYNTQTRRLTADSFAAVFSTVRAELEGVPEPADDVR